MNIVGNHYRDIKAIVCVREPYQRGNGDRVDCDSVVGAQWELDATTHPETEAASTCQ